MTVIEKTIEVRIRANEDDTKTLNRLWGYEDGLVPLEITGPSPHRDASYRIHNTITVQLIASLKITKEGERTVVGIRVDGEPKPLDQSMEIDRLKSIVGRNKAKFEALQAELVETRKERDWARLETQAAKRKTSDHASLNAFTDLFGNGPFRGGPK